MDKQALKSAIMGRIERRKDEIIQIGDHIFRNPETGFKEFKTAEFVISKFRELGLKVSTAGDYPGVKVTIDTGREGPGVAVVAELDSIICTSHPDCDKETGAAHACGHNAQIAAMLGAAMGIVESSVIKEFSGKLHFIAVPAEEYIEIAYRMELKKKGILKYLGGKPELLRKGFFDDVDICIAIHTSTDEKKKIILGKSTNGCIAKFIRYIGKAAHAGGSPHKGINALYAANLGLSAINAVRETFTESQFIRVHPIITKGGEIVNVIPGDVHLETFVRGKTLEDILKASIKVDRAFAGGAYAIGAKVEIQDIPGYFPAIFDEGLREIAKEVSLGLVGEEYFDEGGHGTGSTDWGDLSTIMPVLETNIAGASGTSHGADYRISDPNTAYILGAKYLALMAAELLINRAERAKAVIANFKPKYSSHEEYFKHADKLFRTRLLPETEYSDRELEEFLIE